MYKIGIKFRQAFEILSNDMRDRDRECLTQEFNAFFVSPICSPKDHVF